MPQNTKEERNVDTKIKMVPVQLTDAMRAVTTHAESFDEAWGLALAAVPEAPQADAQPVAEVTNKFGDPEAFAERELTPLADIQKLKIGTKLYTHPNTADIEQCYEHALSAMEGEADRLRAQLKRDSAEAAALQSYLVGTARTIRPVDGSGLYAWALAALKDQAVQS